MKKLQSALCLLVCLAMLLGPLSGFAQEANCKPPEENETLDAEIQKAIALGFVPEALQGDYESQISYAEFCSILDNFVSVMFPDSLSAWESASENYRNADALMCRQEGALVLLYAAECCGVDAIGYQYNIPLEDLIADDVDFFEGLTWDYPLLPDISLPYYNETLANSELFAWRCEFDYADNAKRFVEYMSFANGKTYFDYDERYSLNLGSAMLRGDAIRAVERLYENARFAKYTPTAEAACTVSEAAIAAGKTMPPVSWRQIPAWRGYSIGPGYWNAYHGAGLLYEKEGVEVLSALGFNFVRAPLDSRAIFKGSDASLVNSAYLETMDDLIEYCADAGIHVCFDLHDMPGFNTAGEDSAITLWYDEETQEHFTAFWRFLAEYYKDVPSNLLSFNLLNEPRGADGELPDEVYSAVMRKAIDAIRSVTPDRLIFIDTPASLDGVQVKGLADAQIVQTLHPYFLGDGTTQWPIFMINLFVHKDNGVLTLKGDFPAGTKIAAKLESVQGDSTFCLNADGKTVASIAAGTEAIGENGCHSIYEEGTEGEYRQYDGIMLECELPEACRQIQLVQEGGCWYDIRNLSVETDAYTVKVNSDFGVAPDETVPTLLIDENGGLSAEKDGTLILRTREWLEDLLRPYRELTEQTGTLVMVQEFGFNETIDYQATLAAAEDFLSVLDEYGIPWCSWYGNFGPVMDHRECEWAIMWQEDTALRRGAQYQLVSENWMIDVGLMEVYQRHMK